MNILAAITREFQILNYIEAGLWILLGVGAAAQVNRASGAAKQDLIILSITLVLFGLSDVVETRTGAWWRPWWLLMWKAVCVVVLCGLLVRYLRRRRH